MCCRTLPGGQEPPKFKSTLLGSYLAQSEAGGAREAVVHLDLALEGTAVRVLLDLAPVEQRDLQAPTRALERQ